MPGRLVMDQPATGLSQDIRKDRNDAQMGNPQQVQDFALKPAASSAALSADHGPNGSLPNGAFPLTQAPPTTNGHIAEHDMVAPAPSSPPPLDQSWRASDANKSMGTLLERLSQRCFVDLNEAITKMAEMPAPPQASQPNGISPHVIDTTESSVGRKRMFMEFAHNQRDRFIKTLVLADWSRNEEDMARLIDIRVWQDKQRNSQSNAISFIGTIKHNLVGAKMPNPNIEGALELLATGKSSHVPDLGYLPPKRLTAKQLLKTLQNMNVTLATRLNVSEELPAHFNDYAIANGRATFRVSEEFEVDLSVADDDPTSPFYFIDIAFLFSPAAQVLNEQLRAALEARCNHAMAEKGLQGCYDFLHNFVLTHKINLLRSQANELRSSKWFDCIRLDTPRRIFALQYWCAQPGRKSWLEFSIITGKRSGVQSRKPPTSRLDVRWFRRGVEVTDESLNIDWKQISLEKILSCVIAKHISWSLQNLRERLVTLAGDGSKLESILNVSSEIPEECSLTFSLPSTRSPLMVKFEPVTGQISLSPPSPITINSELRLNREPNADVTATVAGLICSAVQERVGKTAELLGWLPVGGLARQDNLNELFGKGVQSRSIYTCNRGWGSEWALVATFALSGEQWWVVRLEPVIGENNVPNGRIISIARRVPVAEAMGPPPRISQQALLQIERLAEAEVSFTALSKELTAMRVQHRVEKLVPLQMGITTGEPLHLVSSVAMYISSSALLNDVSSRRRNSWNTDFVRVTHEDVAFEETANSGAIDARHEIRLTVKAGQLQNLQAFLAKGRQQGIAIDKSGTLAIRLCTPFGQPFAKQLRARLHHVERLEHYLAVLKAHNFRCTTASLSKIAFRYCESPALAAQLTFSTDGSLPIRIRFEPAGNNPHQRIRAILERYINGHNKDFFTSITQTLGSTLQLLQTFERIETTDSTGRQSVVVHVRQPLWFSLAYKAPFPTCSFDIRCRTKSHEGKMLFIWHISRSDRTAGAAALPEALTTALKELYHQQGRDWWGTGHSILAKPSSVAAALERLNNAIRQVECADVKPSPEDLDSKPLIQQTSVKISPPLQRAPQQAQSTQLTQRPQQQQQRQQSQQQSQQQQKARPMQSGTFSGSFNRQNRPPGTAIKSEVIELD